LKQPDEITELQEAIQSIYGCRALYSRTVHVREDFPEEVAWDGFVRVFSLLECPKAKHCFAWSYRQGKETKTIAVLEIPPVDSPQAAVRAAIANLKRNNLA
jgi:hypothetical protein